jgi:hypothetical protein
MRIATADLSTKTLSQGVRDLRECELVAMWRQLQLAAFGTLEESHRRPCTVGQGSVAGTGEIRLQAPKLAHQWQVRIIRPIIRTYSPVR